MTIEREPFFVRVGYRLVLPAAIVVSVISGIARLVVGDEPAAVSALQVAAVAAASVALYKIGLHLAFRHAAYAVAHVNVDVSRSIKLLEHFFQQEFPTARIEADQKRRLVLAILEEAGAWSFGNQAVAEVFEEPGSSSSIRLRYMVGPPLAASRKDRAVPAALAASLASLAEKQTLQEEDRDEGTS